MYALCTCCGTLLKSWHPRLDTDDLVCTWEQQRFLQEHGEVELSALGVAISSMVTLAEILKHKQLAVETRVVTSLEEISSESR